MNLEKEIEALNEKIGNLEAENERLKRNEIDLIEMNASKDKFLAIISHDLRNPMNTVVGLTELMERNVERNNFNSIGEYAKYIKQSTQRIKNLLVNLLNWSISQNGRMEFNPTEIRLTTIIQEVLDLFEEMLEQKKITLLV